MNELALPQGEFRLLNLELLKKGLMPNLLTGRLRMPSRQEVLA